MGLLLLTWHLRRSVGWPRPGHDPAVGDRGIVSEGGGLLAVEVGPHVVSRDLIACDLDVGEDVGFDFGVGGAVGGLGRPDVGSTVLAWGEWMADDD